MTLPNKNEIEKFGPLIAPFGRNTRKDKDKKIVASGEDLLYDLDQGTYDATSNGYPPNTKYISTINFSLLIKNCPRYKDSDGFIENKYLWVIGTWGLRIIPELTRNVARAGPKKYVCHTNLTGGKHAYQGGELWFCEDGRTGINYFSDRYGATTEEQWETVLNHFRRVKYNTILELCPIDL